MIPRIRKFISFPYSIYKLLLRNSNEMNVYRYFKNMQRSEVPSGDTVLLECVEDLNFLALYGQIISSLREQSSIRVEQFVSTSLRVRGSSTFLAYLIYSIINRLRLRVWVKLYKSFCDGIGYRSMSFNYPLGDVIDAYRAFVCWRSLGSKDELISFIINDISLGDLINDSYLRFRPAATVNLDDTYLWLVIWQAHRDVRRAKYYFNHVKPKLYITTYSTYIQHGIAVRVALKCGVRVFSFGSHQMFGKELSKQDWVHVKNTDDYAEKFSRLANPKQKLEESNVALMARISGVIDSSTAYMRKSAYAKSDEPMPDVQGAIVVFLHDFFDSPHCYRSMVFSDFWEWICFTIDTLEKFKIQFFIKPHPNQIKLSVNELNKLKNRYPNAAIISPTITNKQLAEAGMACAVTVHGTVAHEMAYLGVPTIGCGDNPHVSFSFCNTAKSKADYLNALCRYKEIEFDKPAMFKQSLAFYFMHNLALSNDERMLLETVRKIYYFCDDSSSNKEGLLLMLNTISENQKFKAWISKLSEILNNK